MAVDITSNKKLNYTAGLDIQEAMKNAKILEKELAGLGVGMSKVSDANYKAAQLAFQEATKKSREELAKLKVEEQELKNARLKTASDTAEITKKINENRLAQQELNKATKLAREANKAAAGSYKEASDRLNALGKEIKNTTNGFFGQSPALKAKIKEYDELNARLKAFDASMGNHQRNVGNYPKILNNVGEELKSMALGFISATAVLAGISKIISTNAEISDSMATVRRTTGLTAKEVANLADVLAQINTRTSLKGLLEIATIGGQLGIAKDQLAGFTKAVDGLAVSLGGELQGGAEGIAKSLGVLDNVFKITASNGGDVELSLNQIGSAILGLGQSGLATGDFLADFGERVGGIAKQVGLSLPTVLAYGAVLQENGVSAEVAGTSFKKLISTMSVNTKGFLAIAQLEDSNLTLSKFKDIINNDVRKALDLFFLGLKKGGGTTTEFMAILKDLGLAQSGVSQAVAALANGQESLSGHIQGATTDFQNATIAADQAALANETLGGSLQKLQNSLDNITTNPESGIGKALKYIIDSINETIKALGDAESKLRRFISVAGYFNAGGLIYKGINFIKDIGKVGGYINGTPVSVSEYAKYQKSIREEEDRVNAANSTTAFNLIGNTKNREEALKRINAEQEKLNKITKDYNDNLAYAKDIKNKDKTLLDGAINATIRLKKEQDAQKLSLEATNKLYEKMYGKPADNNNKSSIQNLELEDKKSKGAREKALREMESAADRQEKLQNKIQEAIDKANIKQLSAYDQDVANVKKYYADLRKLAADFNSDKKNKGLKVDVGGLTAPEKNTLKALAYIEETKLQSEEFEKQKKLYTDYENYKTTYGQAKAKERFGAIKTNAQQIATLEKDIAEMASREALAGSLGGVGAFALGGGKGLTDAERDRLKLKGRQLEELVRLEKDAQDKIFLDAYNAAKTYSQKAIEIEADYQTKRKALGSDATKEQLANLNKEREDRIRANNEANAFAKSGYSELMANYDELTRGEIAKRLRAIIAGYEAEYKAGKLTAEQLAKLSNPVRDQLLSLASNDSFNRIGMLIDEWKDKVSLFGKESIEANEAFSRMAGGISDNADDINTVLGSMSGALGEIGVGGEQLQDVFKNVMGIVGGIGGIAKGLASGNPVDIITGSITLLTSAIQLFSRTDKRIENSIIRYKKRVDELTASFDRLERAVNKSVGEAFYDRQIEQIDVLTVKIGVLNEMYFAEKGKKNADKSKLAEYLDQIRSAQQEIEDINARIAESLISTNFKSLTSQFGDALVEAYQRIGNAVRNAGDPIKETDKVFKNMVANAIKNSLQLKLLEPVIAKFTTALSDFAKNNNNSVIGFDFAFWKKQLDFAAAEFSTALGASSEYFKLDLDPPDNSQIEAFGSKLFSLITKEAKEAGKDVEEILRASILDGLRAEVVTDAIKPLAERIKSLYADGKIPTKDEIAKATEEMNAFIANARAKLKTIEEATGLSFGEVIKDEIGGAVEVVDYELQSLSDSIRDIFANTDGAYENFLNKFDDMVKNKLLSGFQTNFLQTKLADFMTQFNAIDKLEENKKAEQLALLRAQFDKIVRDGKAEYERLQGVFGVDYSTAPSEKPTQGAISSGIERITEDTANAIAGPILGTFEQVTKSNYWLAKIYSIGTENLAYQAQIEANTRRGANNTDNLDSKLDAIIANTATAKKQSLTDNYFKI